MIAALYDRFIMFVVCSRPGNIFVVRKNLNLLAFHIASQIQIQFYFFFSCVVVINWLEECSQMIINYSWLRSFRRQQIQPQKPPILIEIIILINKWHSDNVEMLSSHGISHSLFKWCVVVHTKLFLFKRYCIKFFRFLMH